MRKTLILGLGFTAVMMWSAAAIGDDKGHGADAGHVVVRADDIKWGPSPPFLPAGAQAAWCAVMSYEAGVMTIFPDLTPEPVAGNWANGVSGPLGIFYMFVPLSPQGKFKFHAYFTGHRFFDVWGYLL